MPSFFFYIDGRMDVTFIVAFRSFGNAPNDNQLTMYRGVIAVCSEIHTNHINTLCGHNIQGVIKNYRDLVSENYNLLLMAKNI
jgi:hypothetical protein